MLAENRVCEVVEVRFTAFAPVLLGVFSRCSSLNYFLTPAVDTRLRLAETGETETIKTASRDGRKTWADSSSIVD
jgi:hypothetical protein